MPLRVCFLGALRFGLANPPPPKSARPGADRLVDLGFIQVWSELPEGQRSAFFSSSLLFRPLLHRIKKCFPKIDVYTSCNSANGYL